MKNFKGSEKYQVFTPPPIKKHFKTMQEMIKDASKYSNAGEHEISDKILSALVEYINKNKSQKSDRCNSQ